MHKVIKTGVKGRDQLIAGANFVADAVKATLGPFGISYAMEKGNKITRDGVTVSKDISGGIKDEMQRRGAIIFHEAASKTNDEAGDGTTTAETLAQAILKEALRYLPTDKALTAKKTPADIISILDRECKEVTEKLKAMAVPVNTEEELIASALVSVKDPDLAKLIGSAQWQLGKAGILIAEETAERLSSFEPVKGVRIDNGFGTSIAINNQEKQSLEVNDCQVILTNHTLQHLGPLQDVLNQILRSGKKNVIIVARAFADGAIKDCQENVKQGFNVFPINAPYTNQTEVMKDLEAVLGGKFINSEDTSLEDVQLSDVGYAERIVAKRYTAIITGKNDDKAQVRVEKRIEELKAEQKGALSDFLKRGLEERISQLTTGFGIIKIGDVSETARKAKKDNVDDAVNAVRAAFQEGVVPGAGQAFKTISEGLSSDYILKKPLLSIYEQIMSTAPTDFVIEQWVRDPLKVLRIALEKACSVAGTFASIGGGVVSANPQVKYMQEASQLDEEGVE